MKNTNTSFKKSIRGMTLSLAVLLMLSGTPTEVSAATTDNAVLLMASMGVITPDSSGSYNLNNTLTRAEWATMLVKASSYDNMVASSANSSPFKDVKSTHWASAYVKVAASAGLLSGYSDGNFRPDDAVTLEQAVNSVLILMGYISADFSGAYPHAQMNVFNSTKLSNNITGTVGSSITKETAVKLLYNSMSENVKDSNTTYAETLGYALNSSGEVDYADVISTNMNGPYTVKSSDWTSELGIASGAVIYKNGTAIGQSDVNIYDIIYYSTDKGTVYAYSDKVTGIYEKASPNQSTVTSVTVSGKEYQLESTTAFTAFSTSGNLTVGGTVTLLLGKDGKVADAVSSLSQTQDVYLYVTDEGTKTFVDSDNNNYTAQYIKGITSDGNEVEYSVSSYDSWVSSGSLVKLTFSGQTIKVGNGERYVTGTVQSDLRTIGSSTVSSDAVIIDTYQDSYKIITLDRLDGITLDSDNVLYYKAVNGQITELILDDVTGDAKTYVVVTSASSGETSGTYEYVQDGEMKTLNSSNKSLSVRRGAAYLVNKSGQLDNMTNLDQLGTGTVSDVTTDYVVSGGTSYYFSPEVLVYIKSAGGDYKLTNIDAALTAGKSAAYYYDDKPENGGRIRIVVITE